MTVADRNVTITVFRGHRQELAELFELAEDSPRELARYLQLGDVLVACIGHEVIGHVQLMRRSGDDTEIVNMAVRPDAQGSGVGRALVEAAADHAHAAGANRLIVGTAAAGIGQLRFYQRVGFRMYAVERDVFTTANGYPPGLIENGIPVRDRVWLDRPL